MDHIKLFKFLQFLLFLYLSVKMLLGLILVFNLYLMQEHAIKIQILFSAIV